jgi:hypothetical protein
MFTTFNFERKVRYDVLLSKFYNDPSAGFFLYVEELSVDLRLTEEVLYYFVFPFDGVEIVLAVELCFVDEVRIAVIRV